MRENTFRGKKIFGGGWVYGYYTVTFPNARDWKGDLRENPPQCDVIVCAENGITYAFPVDPATIGRYTGMEDVTGTPVFDGDIIVCESERRLSNKPIVVKLDPLSGYWMLDPDRKPRISGNTSERAEHRT